MSKYTRYQPVISSNNQNDDYWLKKFEESLKVAVQPKANDQSIFDQINSIVNGTKPRYSSVAAAVEEMKNRSGLTAYLDKIKTSNEANNSKIAELNKQIQASFENKEWEKIGYICGDFDKLNNKISNAADVILNLNVEIPLDKWALFTSGYVKAANLSHQEKVAAIKFTQNIVSKLKKKASTPSVIKEVPEIAQTINNIVIDSKGFLPVPAILDRVKSLYNNQISNSALWEEDGLKVYIHNLNSQEEAKYSNKEVNHNLGKTDRNNNDIDAANTDAFFGLNPVKASSEYEDALNEFKKELKSKSIHEIKNIIKSIKEDIEESSYEQEYHFQQTNDYDSQVVISKYVLARLKAAQDEYRDRISKLNWI